MVEQKYFGTDGIRGRVGASVINPEFILKLGWAVGRVLTNGERKKVLIGKDTRVSGYMFESALEAGLSAAGVDIHLLGPMPTPAIAYLTRTLRASAGIVISASHNVFSDNGIKFFSHRGEKLGRDIESAIERELSKPMETVESEYLGKATRIDDAPGRYIEFCKSTIRSDVRLNGLKIILDCANGATYHIAPNVFTELGAEVITLASEPDGFNINERCGSTHPEVLQKIVKAESADLGIAFDGDGDRVILVDDQGRVVDGDEILYLIAKDRLASGQLEGVVGTVMSNYGLEQSFKELGVEFVRAAVGDRYVMEALRERNWTLGGEASGHVVCLNKTTTGDGIVVALQVLAAMTRSQQSLRSLVKGMGKYPQHQINVKTTDANAVLAHPNVMQALSLVESELDNRGRVLLRASGTEPVTRVMVEGKDTALVKKYASELARVVEKTAGMMS